jgi:hypothetical protein
LMLAKQGDVEQARAAAKAAAAKVKISYKA